MGFPNYYIEAIANHDIPLKGRRIVSDIGLMLGVGKTPIPLLRSISVSFEKYGYSPISPVGRGKRRSLSVTFNIKEANSKVAKCNLRKSNPNNYGLNKRIILDVGLTVFPKWECDQIAILALWLYHMISVQTDSVKVESVVRCGQRCTP